MGLELDGETGYKKIKITKNEEPDSMLGYIAKKQAKYVIWEQKRRKSYPTESKGLHSVQDVRW